MNDIMLSLIFLRGALQQDKVTLGTEPAKHRHLSNGLLTLLAPLSQQHRAFNAWQGREKDVVIFSAVRTRKRGGIGFVADERRINVGLTRARSSLLVLGNAHALEKDAVWASLIQHCRSSG